MSLCVRISTCAAALFLSLQVSTPATLLAQTTALSYQGRLGENGQPANGAYDFRFTLFDKETGGTAVGNPILLDDLSVASGAFTTLLDFGSEAFDGRPLWIDVAVRPGKSTGAYASLTPRQPIAATPYAIRASVASSLQGSGIVTLPMLAPAAVTQLQEPAAALKNQLQTGNNTLSGTLNANNPANTLAGKFTGIFQGDGAGLTNVVGGNASALVDAERAARAVALAKALADLLGGANTWTGTNRFSGPVSAIHGSNSFAGRFAGDGAGLTNLPTTAFSAALDTERTARAAALAKSLADLLAGTNAWSGPNAFAGPVTAINATNVFAGRFVGDGGGLTNLPAAPLNAALDAERIARAAALAASLDQLLNGANRWSGSNFFGGPVVTTNKESKFLGQFTGTFSGDGTGITTLPATSIAGKLDPTQLPGLDASAVVSGVLNEARLPGFDAAKITTGTLADARLSNTIVRRPDLLSTSNALTATLTGTTTAIDARITAEQSTRASAIAAVAPGLLTGTNLWTGSNQFAGPLLATNPANRVQGDLRGSFFGDGGGITNLPAGNLVGTLSSASVPASVITGTLTPGNIPNLDGSKITTGTLPDTRISTNLARVTELAKLDDTLRAVIKESTPTGLTVVSASSDDSLLTSRGYALFTTLPAPPWANGPTIDAPSARNRHGAAWTGEELVVWGGFLGAGVSSGSGSRFSPTTGTWLGLPTFGAPTARESHTAVWGSPNFIVWGGLINGIFQANGGRLNLSTLAWSPVQTTGAPSARANHVSVWTGSRMVIWGGRNTTGYLNDGGVYDPVGNNWVPLPTTSAPAPRHSAPAVFASGRLIIWGGDGVDGERNDGAFLEFPGEKTPGNWQAINSLGAPSARSGHTLVWTGNMLAIWGGKRGNTYLNDGAIYEITSAKWFPITGAGAPSVRASHNAVWTGKEMLIYGGENGTTALATGALYSIDSDRWQPLTSSGSPVARSESTGVWTGSEFLIFGGQSNGQVLSSLQRVSPQPTWYFYRKP